jgi:hypothetical protein
VAFQLSIVCPYCGGEAELVTDGAITTAGLMTVKRSDRHPHGTQHYSVTRWVPFYACTRCEWCEEAARAVS